MNRNFRINWPAVVLAAAFIVFAGYQSMAMRHLIGLQPPVVATVDLHRVLTQSEARKRVDREIEQVVADLRRNSDQRAAKVQELEEELALYAAGSDKHQEVLEKVTLAALEYQGFSELARRRVESESARQLRRLYAEVREIAREEAREKGYDMVMVNDSIGELRPGDEADVSMQISMRRLLYSNEELDITDDIIARLNATAQAQR